MQNKQIYDVSIATDRIKDYCAIQDRCQWDVIKKMNEWKLGKRTQNYLLEILITEDYINEKRFAQSFCRGKFKIKNWGRVRINNELKQRKISDACIKEGMKEIDGEDYLQLLDKLFKRKKLTVTEKNHFIRKTKIGKFLIQKGFEPSLVWEKVNELKDK